MQVGRSPVHVGHEPRPRAAGAAEMVSDGARGLDVPDGFKRPGADPARICVDVPETSLMRRPLTRGRLGGRPKVLPGWNGRAEPGPVSRRTTLGRMIIPVVRRRSAPLG